METKHGSWVDSYCIVINYDDADDDKDVGDDDDDGDDDRLMESQTRKEAPFGRFGEAPVAFLHISSLLSSSSSSSSSLCIVMMIILIVKK